MIRSRRGVLATATAVTVGLLTWLVVPGAHAGPNRTTLVGPVPSTLSPNVIDGSVNAIYDAGSRILAGGTFTRVRNRDSDTDIVRSYLLAFDKATGVVDPTFRPTVNGEITAILAGPTAGTAYGRRDVQHRQRQDPQEARLINTSTGALVTTFRDTGVQTARSRTWSA